MWQQTAVVLSSKKNKKTTSPSSNKWCKHTLKENSKKKENFEENLQLFAFKTAAD